MKPPGHEAVLSISGPPPEEQRAIISLSLIEGIGSCRIFALIEEFKTARNVLNTAPERLARLPGIGIQTAVRVARFDRYDVADRQIQAAARVGAQMITRKDHRYPYLLQQIYDAPYFLWVRGTMPPAEKSDRSLAIVGTRRPSHYGERVAHDLACELARLGFTIVSGLAYGIDAAAHRGAIEAGGRTIAVLGSGVDRIYPGRHLRLAREMMERGAVVSEYSMGEKPEAQNFPRRNRVISGMTLGTMVVEAYERGGALITARLAVEQNREVFAVPGSIYSKSSDGTHELIRSGATLVRRLDDVIAELGFVDDELAYAAREPAFSMEDLEPEERALVGVLTADPVHIDRICEKARLDPATALVHLLGLEFKGVVRQLAGKQFFLVQSITKVTAHDPE